MINELQEDRSLRQEITVVNVINLSLNAELHDVKLMTDGSVKPSV